ncbi:unnamed protein product [Gongylonema pulchrum]|uniref:CTCHY-type domain-containing protein n=1 Tax=Gongylonema pulchrum TaxID=637853 RepID=A0A183DP30_9BILA|nr:unnamed protein product [Gongylonema pulchrum]
MYCLPLLSVIEYYFCNRVNSWKNKAKYYCSKCNDIFLLPHVHPLKGPVSIAELRRPTQLLAPLTQKHSESQYWFSDESLRVLLIGIRNSRCNGVLCIGTPTVFEYLQSDKELRAHCKSFLLDIDSRFVPFFRSSHFAVYSMLTNHFYDSRSTTKLNAFFATLNRLVIVCDPPFGVFMKPLKNSLNKLCKQFFITGESYVSKHWCKSIIVLPVFVGRRFLAKTGFSMLDYKVFYLYRLFDKVISEFRSILELLWGSLRNSGIRCEIRVCYVNHVKYKRPDKSVVRFFTDLPLDVFDLSEFSNYRFPIIDGYMHKHCDICCRCVKESYDHCGACKRCHLPQRCPRILGVEARN